MKIQYRGVVYILDESAFEGDMINTTAEFQYKQLLHCVENKDWTTLENRINNMLKWGGIKKAT